MYGIGQLGMKPNFNRIPLGFLWLLPKATEINNSGSVNNRAAEKYQYCFHVLLVVSARIGKISSLPASMSKIRISLLKVL